MHKKIETRDVHTTDVHSDAYDGFEITCPECNGKVVVASASWWSDKCECGFSWYVDIRAIGEKYVPD